MVILHHVIYIVNSRFIYSNREILCNCHESYPPQAAWGAKDLDVQKSSPLQVVAVG